MSSKYEYALSDIEESMRKDLEKPFEELKHHEIELRFKICTIQRAELVERIKEMNKESKISDD